MVQGIVSAVPPALCRTQPTNFRIQPARAAKSAGIGELDSSIAKDLIDSEDPKHTLFCRDLRAF